MNDVRIVTCEDCKGSGEEIIGLPYEDEEAIACRACGGSGRVEAEVQPVSLEEAANAQGDGWHERAER